MRTSYLRLALVALPALFAASCGGDNLFGGLDMGSTGACPAGVTVYRVANGQYPPVVGSAMITSDQCGTGLMGSDLETTRTIQNDSQGNITLYNADGTTIIGSGPVRCNTATLAYGPTGVIEDGAGVCQFKATYSVNYTGTADNAFSIQVTQTRSEVMSVPGQNCTAPQNCQVSYKLSLKL